MGVIALAAPRTAEKRRLGMHPKLLMDVIKRQAGTLAKAILEGIMNWVDAGATMGSITLTDRQVILEDGGKGITERSHIEKFFETFGQPHDASEGKIFAKFRMGRGQMFAFGRNTWRTGPFEMVVDIDKLGLDYELKSNLKPHKGCHIVIDLYQPLSFQQLAETERTLEEWVKYSPIPVFLNNKQISLDVTQEKWNHVTPEAYIKLSRDKGSLVIYNLGIHTMDLPSHRLGCGGIIVSRKDLMVNFARNDVMSECPVWKKIKPFVEEAAGKQTAKKATLNDAERQHLCERIRRGDIPDGAEKLRLFTAVNGRHFSAEQVTRDLRWKYRGKVTHTKSGSRQGDKIFQSKLAFVFATEALTRFGLTSAAGIVKLAYRLCGDSPEPFKAIKFESIAKQFSDSHHLLTDKELTPIEEIWKDLARFALHKMGDWQKARKPLIGMSGTALAWTDGSTYIAFNRDYLRQLNFDLQGISSFIFTLIHEQCHDSSDAVDHDHGHEFYEAFHDLMRDKLPMLVDGLIGRLPQIFQTHQRRMTQKTLVDLDRHAAVVESLESMLKAAQAKAKNPGKVKPVDDSVPDEDDMPYGETDDMLGDD